VVVVVLVQARFLGYLEMMNGGGGGTGTGSCFGIPGDDEWWWWWYWYRLVFWMKRHWYWYRLMFWDTWRTIV
jgi:hypothetical protein